MTTNQAHISGGENLDSSNPGGLEWPSGAEYIAPDDIFDTLFDRVKSVIAVLDTDDIPSTLKLLRAELYEPRRMCSHTHNQADAVVKVRTTGQIVILDESRQVITHLDQLIMAHKLASERIYQLEPEPKDHIPDQARELGRKGLSAATVGLYGAAAMWESSFHGTVNLPIIGGVGAAGISAYSLGRFRAKKRYRDTRDKANRAVSEITKEFPVPEAISFTPVTPDYSLLVTPTLDNPSTPQHLVHRIRSLITSRSEHTAIIVEAKHRDEKIQAIFGKIQQASAYKSDVEIRLDLADILTPYETLCTSITECITMIDRLKHSKDAVGDVGGTVDHLIDEEFSRLAQLSSNYDQLITELDSFERQVATPDHLATVYRAINGVLDKSSDHKHAKTNIDALRTTTLTFLYNFLEGIPERQNYIEESTAQLVSESLAAYKTAVQHAYRPELHGVASQYLEHKLSKILGISTRELHELDTNNYSQLADNFVATMTYVKKLPDLDRQIRDLTQRVGALQPADSDNPLTLHED